MEIEKTNIKEVFIITPRVFKDDRGYFFESFNEQEFFEKTKIPFMAIQDNESCSVKGVLRGLHFQKGTDAQAKLVRCVEGEIFDVAVDVRPESKTFGKHVSVILSNENHKQLYIPKGFAHGFYTLSDKAIINYKCDKYYCPEAEDGITWDDKDINIEWPIIDNKIILSEKDSNRQTLKEYILKTLNIK